VTPASGSAGIAAGRNATIMSLMVCCGYVVCWTPNETAFFLTNFLGVAIDFSGWFYHFTMVLVLMNNCINPVIYAAKYREFQHGIRRMLVKLHLKKPQSQVAPVT